MRKGYPSEAMPMMMGSFAISTDLKDMRLARRHYLNESEIKLINCKESS
jgi:hypothetical protein